MSEVETTNTAAVAGPTARADVAIVGAGYVGLPLG